MARRGAHVEGLDIAEEAIQIAQQYAQENPPRVGSVSYRVADINTETLEPNHYDLIVAVGVLHHLTALESILQGFAAALRPSGWLFVRDVEDTPRINALIAGGLMMVLPTHMSYREKFRHLLRLRGQSVEHMTASIEARGLSPFEGYGRHQDPVQLIKTLFDVRSFTHFSAFTWYVLHQVRLPLPWLRAFGHVSAAVDFALIKTHLLRGLCYALFARRKRDSPI